MPEIGASKQLSPCIHEELKGLKILVTDLDLQQTEHRGIAVYSKSLLRALQMSGAEVWLLTDIYAHNKKLRHLPGEAQSLIETANILDKLANGKDSAAQQCLLTLKEAGRGKMKKAFLLTRLILLKVRAAVERLTVIAWPKRIYRRRDIRLLTLNHYDSPYARHERLNYTRHLQGIVSTKNLYASSNMLARQPKPVSVEIRLGEDFDALITTCPLNMRSCPELAFIQTVHDIIPLEYTAHPDHASAALFSQRLASCCAANKLYVSEATRKKFETVYPEPTGHVGSTIVQPPSLCIGSEFEYFANSRRNIRIANGTSKETTELKSFEYLLFNSSVEPRKNLLFLLRAFSNSGLDQDGIRLCITGKLKKDNHSLAIASADKGSVVITNYIDEATKAELFLNALCILSPSLVEGFGIPVLDAASLGAQVIASTTEPHKEIRKIHDFSDYITLLEMDSTATWASAMRSCARSEQKRITCTKQERSDRMRRYIERSALISEDFRKAIVRSIMEARRKRTDFMN